MSDPRFARLKTDPRFRRPRKHQSKVVVDERFKEIFDEKKVKKSKDKRSHVDKYGRAISDSHERDNLRQFYRLEDEQNDEDAEPSAPDYARGEVLLESSDEEDDEIDDGEVVTLGYDQSKPITIPTDDDEADINLDEGDFADLDAQAAAYASKNAEEEEVQSNAEKTHRIAVVNLDWDHVRAIHLYKIFSSLVSPTAPAAASLSKASAHPDRQRSIKGPSSTIARGKVLSVRVYPSEFGKERMAREEKEGPPADVFKKKRNVEEEEVNETNIYEVGDEEDYDEDALRRYQLERLRYYYAIVTCDTVDAACHIYSELEGTELERSANVFDLSFVPDDMSFDDECRDEASSDLDTNYKGVDFVTDALRHSKVKLTWDEDDPERNQITRRALTKQEIEEADFKAYLASSTSGSESEPDILNLPKPSAKEKASNKKGAERDKLRALLLGGNDDELPEGWGRGDEDEPKDVDMEITFTPGLSQSKDHDKEETTLQKYERKMKEKRKKRKEELKEKVAEKEQGSRGGIHDDFFDAESQEEEKDVARTSKTCKDRKMTKVSSDAGPRHESTAEELALLAASDNPNTEPKHFNLKSVLKAEKKRKGKKKKPRKGEAEESEIQEDFTIDVKDGRFTALHEDHTFAIDPSNPHFKKTKSMAALLDERSKRQNNKRNNESEDRVTQKAEGNGSRSLTSLVESVKRKSVVAEQQVNGKRRKI